MADKSQFNYISRGEAACLLGVKTETLAKWACTRKYCLPYVKIGARRVMYDVRDIEAFIKKQFVCECVTDGIK